MDTNERRKRMVDLQLRARAIRDERVLAAFASVPREEFLPAELREFAYTDAPLPIAEGQTISQPYVVALTAEAMQLTGGERVLEIGTGSGYAAAILSQLAQRVYTVERLMPLGQAASETLSRLGYDNVEVSCRDGTLGWPEHAPYDAIAVAAGGPDVPSALLDELAVGGRLVMPVGPEADQVLVRVTREADGHFRRETLSQVRFVPLIGEQGWSEAAGAHARSGAAPEAETVTRLVRAAAEPLDLAEPNLDGLLERIDGARLVLLGEATHGTSEFYRLRARISQALIERLGFDFVAVEADWPDAAQLDRYALGRPLGRVDDFLPFSRFPTWLWRNEETRAFIGWLREHNLEHGTEVGFHGLDLYSLFASIAAVLAYLTEVDPDAVPAARARYGRLTPWQSDPAAYGRAVIAGRYDSSEQAVVAMLRDLLARRIQYTAADGERFFDAAQNARVVANAEAYYRVMYYGAAAAWNLRDSHMFETLEALLTFYGPNARGVVWEHNSHVGNALATEMSLRGEHNLGELCRRRYGDAVYALGFGTDHGTVAAAADWDEPLEIMTVLPSHPDSYERVFHDSGIPAFLLPLRTAKNSAVRAALEAARLERAIGVVYRPQTERASHYFRAALPHQFDEYAWFDETRAVTPLAGSTSASGEASDLYPFGL
ncbi:MAG TPA: protein-L-isoaspartate(D-aspartate) O-methyltransferase [Polyangiaceae bacterium]|nr:protein-L-isoaspartate(D-aspartate) O-methyltransferase [Polyangiaceae bacterium]